MKDTGKIVLHIPAREGSQRIPKKNMRLMNGRPMISYTIEASMKSKVTEFVYVNTDSHSIIDYVNKNYSNFRVFIREKYLADNNASSDQFNQDVIEKLQPDTLIMINPVCPLIDAEDIQAALLKFQNSDCDTLITASSTQMQTFCEGKPVNINTKEQLAPSQNNKRISILNWAITIWDAKSFLQRMNESGYAVLGDKRELFDIDFLKSIKVSEEKDFVLAEKLLKIK
jgi:CMP-N,N'-diacetyllegionaminic acid synthase